MFFRSNIQNTRYKIRNSCARRCAGFTLIELVVSVAIITIITSIALVNHSRFNGTIFLSNLAYDVALSVRQAQVFGLSVQEFESSFDVGYGVHFDRTETTSFFIFADLDRDQRYVAANDSVAEQFSITRGNSILRFCGTPPGLGSQEVCSDSELGAMQTLDIVFDRPNPDAIITDNNTVQYSSARIMVISRVGETREVVVESTGQISVTQPGF